MTKWICKGCWCRRCYVDDPNDRIVPNQCPDKGIINPCWERDCTEEKKPLAVVDRLEALEKKDRELEQMLQNHIHTRESICRV